MSDKTKKLHSLQNILIDEFITRIESGEATPSDLNAARQLLKDNGIHVALNPDNPLADPAFQIVKAAHDRLEDEERLQFCVRICTAAEEAVERKVKSQKKKLRKEGEERLEPAAGALGSCCGLRSHVQTPHRAEGRLYV